MQSKMSALISTLLLIYMVSTLANEILFGFEMNTMSATPISSSNLIVLNAYLAENIYQCSVSLAQHQTHYLCNTSNIKTIHCANKNNHVSQFIDIDTKQTSTSIEINNIFVNNSFITEFCSSERCNNILSISANSITSIHSDGQYSSLTSRNLCRQNDPVIFGIIQSNKNDFITNAEFIAITLYWGFYKYKCFIDTKEKNEFETNQTYACNTSHHATFQTYNLKNDVNYFQFGLQFDNNEDGGVVIDIAFLHTEQTSVTFDWFCIIGAECVDGYAISAKHYPHSSLLWDTITELDDGYVEMLPQQYESLFTIPEESKYVIIGTKMNWMDAYDYCNIHYDGLAIVKNRAELTALVLLKNELYRNDDLWIGLTNLEYNGTKWNEVDNGTWIFVNGELIDTNGTKYTLWAPGEPSNHLNKEHCGGIYFDSRKQNYINDFVCNLQTIFACRRPVISSSQNNYSFGVRFPSNNIDAKAGDVVTMSLSYEDELIQCNFNNWQTYQCDTKNFGVHQCTNSADKTQQNSIFEVFIDNNGYDTAYLDAINVHIGGKSFTIEYFCYEKENISDCQDVIGVGMDYHANIAISMSNSFSNIGIITLQNNNTICMTNAKKYEVITELLTFEEAEDYCELATIANVVDYNEIIDIWYSYGGYKNMWIGLKSDDQISWYWTDNKTKCYNPDNYQLCTPFWAPLEPSKTVGERCGGLYAVQNGLINNFACDDKFWFICNQGTKKTLSDSRIQISTSNVLGIIVGLIVLCALIGLLHYLYTKRNVHQNNEHIPEQTIPNSEEDTVLLPDIQTSSVPNSSLTSYSVSHKSSGSAFSDDKDEILDTIHANIDEKQLISNDTTNEEIKTQDCIQPLILNENTNENTNIINNKSQQVSEIPLEN